MSFGYEGIWKSGDASFHRIEVPGDGNCFPYAISVATRAAQLAQITPTAFASSQPIAQAQFDDLAKSSLGWQNTVRQVAAKQLCQPDYPFIPAEGGHQDVKGHAAALTAFGICFDEQDIRAFAQATGQHIRVHQRKGPTQDYNHAANPAAPILHVLYLFPEGPQTSEGTGHFQALIPIEPELSTSYRAAPTSRRYDSNFPSAHGSPARQAVAAGVPQQSAQQQAPFQPAATPVETPEASFRSTARPSFPAFASAQESQYPITAAKHHALKTPIAGPLAIPQPPVIQQTQSPQPRPPIPGGGFSAYVVPHRTYERHTTPTPPRGRSPASPALVARGSVPPHPPAPARQRRKPPIITRAVNWITEKTQRARNHFL